MIGRLTGRILECHPGGAVLDVGGVGYELRIPLSTFYRLSARPDPATLFVHTHVREDAIQLFGFLTRGEREAFEKLIAVSGVGPRIALAVLSGIETEELARAVAESDRVRLERIPGIGRKTAERILLELRDKTRTVPEGQGAADARSRPPAGTARADAVSALVNLGYAPDTAAKAVEGAAAVVPEASGIEALLKEALRRLVR